MSTLPIEHDNMIFRVVPYDISYSTGILEMLNLEDTFDQIFTIPYFGGTVNTLV